MRFNRFLPLCLLILFCSTLFGCAARNNINQDAHNANANVAVSATARYPAEAGFIKPAEGPVYSGYGPRKHPTQKRTKFHKGIDIAAKRGSDVVAAASGKVVFSGRKNGYGKTVEIDHGNGTSTLYAHMDKVFITQGQSLKQGDKIGTVGRTGRTTGPCLHFELLANGQHTNPIPKEGWQDSGSMLAEAPSQPVSVAAASPSAKVITPTVITAQAAPRTPDAAAPSAPKTSAAKPRTAKNKTAKAKMAQVEVSGKTNGSQTVQAARKAPKRPAS